MSGDEVSRRALLGAAVGLPWVSDSFTSSFRGTPESTCLSGAEERWTPDQVRGDEQWVSALAAFRFAEAEVRGTAGSSADEEEVWLPAQEARLEAFGGAVRRVMPAGAPDFAAFAAKLELFFEQGLEQPSVDEEVLAAFRGGAARPAGG